MAYYTERNNPESFNINVLLNLSVDFTCVLHDCTCSLHDFTCSLCDSTCSLYAFTCTLCDVNPRVVNVIPRVVYSVLQYKMLNQKVSCINLNAFGRFSQGNSFETR